MKVRQLLFSWCIFLIAPQFHAQEKAVGMTFSPLSLLDFYNGTHIKGGVYLQFEKWIAHSELGVYTPGEKFNITAFESIDGYNMRQSLHYRLRENSGLMLGANWFHKEQGLLLNDETMDGIVYSTDIQRTINAYNLHVGYQAPLGTKREAFSHLLIWFEAGLGARHQRIRNPYSSYLSNSKEWYDSMHSTGLEAGNRWMPNLDFSIRLLWKW
jgi:hypothetical protein